MAHHHQVMRYPLLTGPGDQARTKHQTVTITNGTKAVSVTIVDVNRGTTQLVTLTAEAAHELGIALLVGAYNVRHEYHANGPLAHEYSDQHTAREEIDAES